MEPTYDSADQVALVTAAAEGLGLATARMFAASGAAVPLAERVVDRVADEEHLIEVELGGRSALDVADEDVVTADQRGVWSCVKHELSVMRRKWSGTIVNCSSPGGLVGSPQHAPYSGINQVMLGMAKSVAKEYAPCGARINTVCLGMIDTSMVTDILGKRSDAMVKIATQQFIGRRGRPEEVAAAVLEVCSPGASVAVGVG